MPRIDAPSRVWIGRKIRIVTIMGTREMDAECLGPLAIHRALTDGKVDPDIWTLTSRTTGLRILSLQDLLTLRRIAQVLNDVTHRAFEELTQGKIIDAVPEWLVTWIQECRDRKTFIDPGTFQKKFKHLRKSP